MNVFPPLYEEIPLLDSCSDRHSGSTMKLLDISSVLFAVAGTMAAEHQQAIQPDTTTLNCSSADYQQTMLAALNIHRSNHSAVDLVWNTTLATAAQNTSMYGVIGEHE